jgi:hypothetical protein
MKRKWRKERRKRNRPVLHLHGEEGSYEGAAKNVCLWQENCNEYLKGVLPDVSF